MLSGNEKEANQEANGEGYANDLKCAIIIENIGYLSSQCLVFAHFNTLKMKQIIQPMELQNLQLI